MVILLQICLGKVLFMCAGNFNEVVIYAKKHREMKITATELSHGPGQKGLRFCKINF